MSSFIMLRLMVTYEGLLVILHYDLKRWIKELGLQFCGESGTFLE